jgi:RNA polymerase sigma-70 factor, ECF subfamily
MRTLEDLLVSYSQADAAAFDALYARVSPLLYAIAMRRLGHDADAQDAVQKTFLKIHRHVLSYDPAKPAMAWIAGIARNVIADVLRERAKHGAAHVVFNDEDAHAATEKADGSANAELEVDRLLAALSVADRELLRSRLLSNESFEILATRMQVSPASLRQRFSRLVRRLRRA